LIWIQGPMMLVADLPPVMRRWSRRSPFADGGRHFLHRLLKPGTSDQAKITEAERRRLQRGDARLDDRAPLDDLARRLRGLDAAHQRFHLGVVERADVQRHVAPRCEVPSYVVLPVSID
jgi:hypothetical protein